MWLAREKPEGFALYSGDDATCIALMLLGGQGNVSVTANLAPKAMSQMCRAAVNGDLATARAIQMKLLPLHKQLFSEANPIPVKWAMSRLGLCGPAIRLPLTPFSPSLHGALEGAMRESGLL
jgi:4-hydroxy-tetrahydrodipicolinate synthase